jgi:hypothetical protein
MKSAFKILALTAALAAGAAALPAQAQDAARDMDFAITMLESTVQRGLNQLGIGDVDVMALSLNQLNQIRLVLNEDGMESGQRVAHVQNIIRRN